jgi:hypothetical protein
MGDFGVRTRDTSDNSFLVAVSMTAYVTAATGQTKDTRIKLARITAGRLGRKLVDYKLKRKKRGE